MLQVLDDGRLTDGQGRTISFKNTIIIMTSNLGSNVIADVEDEKELSQRLDEVLHLNFRPEFLNRIDEIVIFHRLDRKQIKQIVEIQLKRLVDKLIKQGIKFTVTESAKELLAKEGFDPAFGARPLKRTIQRLIQNPLAMKLIEGEFKEGDVVVVDQNPENPAQLVIG